MVDIDQIHDIIISHYITPTSQELGYKTVTMLTWYIYICILNS